MQKQNNLSIAFFVGWLHALNETFISNELFALQKQNIRGDIYYQRINTGIVQPVSKKITFPTYPLYKTPYTVQRKYIGRIFRVNIRLLIRNPFGYARAIRLLLSTRQRKNISLFIRASLLSEIFREKRYTHIYIHDGEIVSLLGMFCGCLTGIPCGIIFHTEHLFAQSTYVTLKCTFSDFSIFQSEYSRLYAIRMIHASDSLQKRMHVIYSPGVDVETFSQRHQYTNIHKNKSLHLICVSRLEKMKGLDLLIDAIHILTKRGIPTKCSLVGYGSQKTQLQKQIRSLSLEKHVVLEGRLTHSKRLLQLLHAADLFVLPSIVNSSGDRDMQPNAVKEAMAMGLIVLTTDFGGIRELIQHGKNGFLLDSTDPITIARSIEKIYALTPGKKQQISKTAVETIRRSHTRDYVTHTLVTLLQSKCSR